MTNGDGAAAGGLAAEPASPDAAARRRRIWPVIAAITVVGLAAAALAFYLYWRSDARALYPYSGVSNRYSAGRVGRTVYVDAAVQPRQPSTGHEQLDVRSLTPRIVVNSAAAKVVLLYCRRGSSSTSGIGLTLSTSPYCSSARVTRPGPVDLGFPVTQVIYAVTARRPGVVRIEGCNISYRIGSRIGTQHVGVGFVDHVQRGPQHRSHS